MRSVLFSVVTAVLLVPVLAGCVGRSKAPPRPIVLVTVDTLRADRLGAYGASRPTPAFDRIAAEGALVETAVAPFGRTTQSVGSILTGLHPLRHGADGLGMSLPDRVTTLAERLHAAGYGSAAFVSNHVLNAPLGFGQGFDLYSNPVSRWAGNSAAAVVGESLAWLENRKDERPFFLWLHILDPHWTYEPAPRFAAMTDPGWSGAFTVADDIKAGRIPWGRLIFDAPAVLDERGIEHMRSLYDAEVLATDDALAAFLAGLERLGWLDRVVLAVTADHGESLGEHHYWFAHGEYIYDEVLRVPMLLRAPAVIPAGTRVTGVVRLEDLAPTLLDLANGPALDDIDGRSVGAPLRAGGTQAAPPATAIHLSDHLLLRDENPRREVPGREGRWWAIRDGSLKLIRIPRKGDSSHFELYDTATDPGESRDLIDERAGDAASLRERLEAAALELLKTAPTDDGDAPAADPDALRSLGYVGHDGR